MHSEPNASCDMNSQAAQVPLVELLRGVPKDHRVWFELGYCHHQHIPIGKYCHEAADHIAALESRLAAYESGAESARGCAEKISIDAMPFNVAIGSWTLDREKCVTIILAFSAKQTEKWRSMLYEVMQWNGDDVNLYSDEQMATRKKVNDAALTLLGTSPQVDAQSPTDRTGG